MPRPGSCRSCGAREPEGRRDTLGTREPRVFSRSEVLAHARDASAILACMADWVDSSFLAACPRLRIISAALKGFDNFDAAACEQRGVRLAIVPDLLTEPAADLAVALTLDLTRRVSEADRDLRANGFSGWRSGSSADRLWLPHRLLRRPTHDVRDSAHSAPADAQHAPPAQRRPIWRLCSRRVRNGGLGACRSAAGDTTSAAQTSPDGIDSASWVSRGHGAPRHRAHGGQADPAGSLREPSRNPTRVCGFVRRHARVA